MLEIWYIVEKDPVRQVEILNEIIKFANDFGIDVLSEIYTLNGYYFTLEDFRMRNKIYSKGYVFCDDKGYELIFPPSIVKNREVYELMFKSYLDFQDNGIKDESFGKFRELRKIIIGGKKSHPPSNSYIDGLKAIQFLENRKNKTIYIPYSSTCQNVFDGPLLYLINSNVIFIEYEGIFRSYFRNYRVLKSKEDIKNLRIEPTFS